MTAGIKRICLIKQLRSGKNFSTRSKRHAKPAVIESIRCYAKQWKITLKGGETMPTEKEMKEARKAVAFDLFNILDQKPEQETYTAEEIKKLITVYVLTANQD